MTKQQTQDLADAVLSSISGNQIDASAEPIVEAVRILAEGTMQADNAILDLVNFLTMKVKELQDRVTKLEQTQEYSLRTDAYSRTRIYPERDE